MIAFLKRLLPSFTFTCMAGAGVAIVWADYSRRAGKPLDVRAILSGKRPTASELFGIITHLPQFIIGLVALLLVARRKKS